MGPSNATPVSRRLLTVPNALTLARLALAIVVFALMAAEWHAAALGVFLVAALSDWLDGYIARNFNQASQFGRVFDPFVDKIIICGAYVFLAAAPGSGVAAWMAVVIMGREMLVTALRSFIEEQGGDFSAKWSGKIKMVVQCWTAALALWLLSRDDAARAAWPAWLMPLSAYAAVAITLYSGVEYLLAAWRLLRPRP